MSATTQYVLYLYDLPKENVTLQRIHSTVKALTNLDCEP